MTTTTITTQMTPHQLEIFEKVVGLRHLTHQGGMITKRSQNSLLASLNDSDLAIVSRELFRHTEQCGW